MSNLPPSVPQSPGDLKEGATPGSNAPDLVNGAVLLLGSLYWEGNEPDQDGTKGEDRLWWRKGHLEEAAIKDLDGLPIRYGRRSGSRNGQFTIVFGGKPGGRAKVAPLLKQFPIEKKAFPETSVEALKKEVRALAKVEGILTDSNNHHWDSWGVVAIAVSPQSPHKGLIEAAWKTHVSPGPGFKHKNFGPDILDENAILKGKLPWAEEGLTGLDFCLLTPTAPKPREKPATPMEIADAIRLSSYFYRTHKSGFITEDDDEIKRLLALP